jgi:hypothetical protein
MVSLSPYVVGAVPRFKTECWAGCRHRRGLDRSGPLVKIGEHFRAAEPPRVREVRPHSTPSKEAFPENRGIPCILSVGGNP